MKFRVQLRTTVKSHARADVNGVQRSRLPVRRALCARYANPLSRVLVEDVTNARLARTLR